MVAQMTMVCGARPFSSAEIRFRPFSHDSLFIVGMTDGIGVSSIVRDAQARFCCARYRIP